jgi:type VI secretion system protein ImpH
MADQDRGNPMSLKIHDQNFENSIKLLLEDPTAFDFFEAVRRSQRLAINFRSNSGANHNDAGNAWGSPLASGPSATSPIISFRANVSNSFPASSIQDVKLVHRRDKRGNLLKTLEMTVNFMGLHGPNGILPRHYNDQLIQLQRQNVSREAIALRDWFDMFNNRMIALFYLSWEKTQLPVQREQSIISGQRDNFEIIFKSLGGLRTEGLERRIQAVVPGSGTSSIRIMSDLFLSTHLARSRPRMSVALVQSLISKATGSSVAIKCYTPRWSVIPEHARAHLGSSSTGMPAQLGVNVSLGSRIISSQSNYSINIGPVDWKGLIQLLPHNTVSHRSSDLEKKPCPKTTIDAIRTLARLKTDPNLKSTIRIRLRTDSLQPARLATGHESSGLDQPSKLGWNMWLGQPKRAAGFDAKSGCKYLEDTEFVEE